MVSRSDLLRALADTFIKAPAELASDDTIRDNVIAELALQSWAPTGGISVTVTAGVVDLDGFMSGPLRASR